MAEVTLELTNEEALAFREWRKYQDQFQVMVEAGVFKTQNGKIELHFNENSILCEITRHDIIYKKIKVLK